MRFSFPLETLLGWKRNLEEFSQLRLGEKIALLKKQEDEIQSLILKRLAYADELQEKARLGIGAQEFWLYAQYAQESQTGLRQRKLTQREMIRAVEAEREKLVSLTKERKILERLKERRFKSFLDQMEKLEQRNIDEQVVMKYPRRKQDPSA